MLENGETENFGESLLENIPFGKHLYAESVCVLQCASVSWEVMEAGQCTGKVAEEWCYGLQRELKKVVWSP